MPQLISVVIPCYRQAHFLAQAVQSVLAQQYSPVEVIVIDDGSPDDVETVVRHFPTVTLLRQENLGLAATRNRGLALSRGDFVVFLDADDRLLPDALAVGAQALATHPLCAFVWGFNRPIDTQGQVLPGVARHYRGGTTYRHLLEQNIVGPPVGVMFRRIQLVEIGGFWTATDYAEDYDLYLRLARQYPYFCHEQVIAEYRYHESKLSSDSRRMLQGMLLALQAQESWVAGDPELARALRRGRQDAWHQYDAEPRLERLRSLVLSKEWRTAIACGASLLLRYPGMFLRVAARQARRALLPSRAI